MSDSWLTEEYDAGKVKLTVEGNPEEVFGLIRLLVPKRPRKPHLKPEVVDVIRRQLAEGKSVAEIADEHKVSKERIQGIKDGRTWKRST